MISYDTVSTPNRLQRAKSSSSTRTTLYVSREAKAVDYPITHKDAITAASFAFECANQRAITINQSRDGELRPKMIVESTNDKLHHLERKQSVRFTGATAIPIRNRSITRRVAPRLEDSYVSSSAPTAYITHQSDNHVGNRKLKYKNHTPSQVSSTHISFRRIRKAKSVFNFNSPRGISLANETPNDTSHTRRRLSGLLSDNSQGPRKKNHRLSRSFSFLHGKSDRLISIPGPPATHDAVLLAQHHFVRRSERDRLTAKSSFLALSKDHNSQEALRESVRSSSIYSRNNQTVLPGLSAAKPTSRTGFGQKARSLSMTVKEKLKRVFHRPAEVGPSLPIQQVEASRPHFREYISASSGIDEEYVQVPSPDGETLQKSRSREFTLRNTPVFLDKKSSPRSIRSVQSEDDATNDRSRVTSWTNSTVASTLTSNPLLEKKRLSIIQEHGRPHQSAGNNKSTDLGGLFQRPLRSNNIGSQVDALIDSRRIYSALQKNIEHSKSLARSGENDSSAECKPEWVKIQASNLRSLAPSSGAVKSAAISTFSQHRAMKRSKSMVFNPSSECNLDDVFNPTQNDTASEDIRKELFDMYTDFTPQKPAEHNESVDLPPKRPLREVKSTFFPSSMRIERSPISPYKQAIKMGMENEVGLALETEENIRGRLPYEGVVRSPSIYSRTSSGNIPDEKKSSLSLAKSDEGEETGRATIIPAGPGKYDQSSVSLVQQSSSSGERRQNWQNWMATQLTPLKNRGEDDTKTFDVRLTKKKSHKKESAQIYSDDPIIDDLGAFNRRLKQSLDNIQGSAAPRPNLRHQPSRPMLDRFPLLEIPQSINAEVLTLNSPTSPNVLSTPSLQSLYVGYRKQTSGMKDYSCRFLDPKASYDSLKSQHSSSMLRQKSFTVSENMPSDAQESLPMGRPRRLFQPKQIGKSNVINSPERIARLRRMRSSNLTGSAVSVESASTHMNRQPENEVQRHDGNENLTTSVGVHDSENLKMATAMNHVQQVAGGRHMVDAFLINRRKNIRISNESGADPAFL